MVLLLEIILVVNTLLLVRFVLLIFVINPLLLVIFVLRILVIVEPIAYIVPVVIVELPNVSPTNKLLAILAPPEIVNPPPFVILVTSLLQSIDTPPKLINAPDDELLEGVVLVKYILLNVELT